MWCSRVPRLPRCTQRYRCAGPQTLRLHCVVTVRFVHAVEEVPQRARGLVGHGDGAILLRWCRTVQSEQLALDAAVLDVGLFVHGEELHGAVILEVVELREALALGL